MVLHNYFFIEFNNNTVRSYMNIQKKGKRDRWRKQGQGQIKFTTINMLNVTAISKFNSAFWLTPVGIPKKGYFFNTSSTGIPSAISFCRQANVCCIRLWTTMVSGCIFWYWHCKTFKWASIDNKSSPWTHGPLKESKSEKRKSKQIRNPT